ncbi:unnamed protein product [Symbiodinium natans]|uniref:Uncharacterized protein n=1 Tax=Symbiodinium natans TaxID=878477 RepID=A0A812R7X7_9DINO|nr:unnamed protein product [Symbiodinium natans]
MGHTRGDLRPFRALCQQTALGGALCPWVFLGPGLRDLRLDLTRLCDAGPGTPYGCNRTLTPACDELCGGSSSSESLSPQGFQSYLDSIMSSNPFGGDLEPWEVPQVDLTEPEAFIFVSQRQALYVALRTLALKLRDPTSRASNALDYGLTYGCNWRPSPAGVPDPEACARFPPLTGVGAEALQGNLFSLLAWARALAEENGVRLGVDSCFWRQRDDPELWCPHDSVLGAMRGGASGPDARAALDSSSFWAKHNLTLEEVGVRPNVCHFESSRWVWRNTRDPAAETGEFCRGFNDVPSVYSPEVDDFMSRDRPWTLAVDIAGAQYGGGCGSANGRTWATQDESTPVFYPETLALGFHSTGRTIGTGTTALVFLGVRRYFSGQSGSHGLDHEGLHTPLFVSGNRCGSLQDARPFAPGRLLSEAVVTNLAWPEGHSQPFQIFGHALGVITSSCGTCMDGNLPNTTLKFRTAGDTCLVSWKDGRSGCGRSPAGGWTYWNDVWTWIGAINPIFYPSAVRPALTDVVRRVATGPWGAGVWWGNTLQYFVIVWAAMALLWKQDALQLDYYAYGMPGQQGFPLGGFCEQYQAQGYEDVVQHLPKLDAALKDSPSATLADLYSALACCSRCDEPCRFAGVGPPPSDVYCTTTCTDDFLNCFQRALRNKSNCQSEWHGSTEARSMYRWV